MIGNLLLLGIYVTAFFVATPCSAAVKGAGNKIYNGRSPEPNSHPWLVWLEGAWEEDENDGLICGGVLVSERYVLTAAHCTDESYGLSRVFVGSDYRTISMETITVSVQNTFTHPDYNATDGSYDVALVQLTTPVATDDRYVEIAEISTDESYLKRFYKGKRQCKLAGWGRTESGNFSQTLHEVFLRAVPDTDCEAQGYDIVEPNFCWKAKKNQRVPCDRDEGGPIVCNNNGPWEVVGIHVKDDCTDGIKSAAKTLALLDWIDTYLV